MSIVVLRERTMAPPYAVIAVYHAGEDNASVLCDYADKIIVFDHVESARQFLPLLSNGRIVSWGADNESACFLPINENGVNRAVIISPYDVYNLPPNAPALSETRSMGWKNHVIWTEMRI
jgi:hypothetical protein